MPRVFGKIRLEPVDAIEFLFARKEDKPALRECTLLVLDPKSRLNLASAVATQEL